MPARVSWPAAIWPKVKRPPVVVKTHVQRLCGHYDWLPMLASEGWHHEILQEQKELCFTCRPVSSKAAVLWTEPRLRIHHEYDIWGVERLMASTAGMTYEIVAFLMSHDECLQWIAHTFKGLRYVIVEDAAIAS